MRTTRCQSPNDTFLYSGILFGDWLVCVLTQCTNKVCIPGPETLQRAHICWDSMWNKEQRRLLSFAFQPQHAHKSTADIRVRMEGAEPKAMEPPITKAITQRRRDPCAALPSVANRGFSPQYNGS
ncbi:unnamed protein product [Lota lota]